MNYSNYSMITLSKLRNWGIVTNDGTISAYPGLSESLTRQIIQELLIVLNTHDLKQYMITKDPRGRKFVVMPDDVIYHLVRRVNDIMFYTSKDI